MRLPADGPSESDWSQLAAAEGLALEGLGPHWHGDRRDHAGPDHRLLAARRERAYPAAVSLLVRVLHRALGRPRARLSIVDS